VKDRAQNQNIVREVQEVYDFFKLTILNKIYIEIFLWCCLFEQEAGHIINLGKKRGHFRKAIFVMKSRKACDLVLHGFVNEEGTYVKKIISLY
jgi:hypothetical protein